jgi:hypothetical protein
MFMPGALPTSNKYSRICAARPAQRLFQIVLK